MQNRIKEFRTKAKLTQEQLADLVGVGINSISDWENGAADPLIQNGCCLAEVLGTTMEDLFPIAGHIKQIKRRPTTKMRFRRQSLGITIKHLSDVCGVPVSTLASYEHYGITPGLFNALLIAKALDTTVDKLFDP